MKFGSPGSNAVGSPSYETAMGPGPDRALRKRFRGRVKPLKIR
jgi:hypothetical protein